MDRRRPDQSEEGYASRIIGRSPAMEALRRLIARVAPTDATVLILGKRGTGKELVAREIQERSQRRDRPFVIVNCAALPTELLASELFGHERGAFTGAAERKVGLVTQAAGGTLFLDEVGDLSQPAQAMLLRFLQEREVRPLGSTRTFTVNVRVVAATNRDLTGAIALGGFRADLYDRLAEIVMRIPPLRDRSDDVALLADHLLQRVASRHGVPTPRLTRQAAALLTDHRWPGNVRELEQRLSRAVLVSPGRHIDGGDLELETVQAAVGPDIGRHRFRQEEAMRLAGASGFVSAGCLPSVAACPPRSRGASSWRSGGRAFCASSGPGARPITGSGTVTAMTADHGPFHPSDKSQGRDVTRSVTDRDNEPGSVSRLLASASRITSRRSLWRFCPGRTTFTFSAFRNPLTGSLCALYLGEHGVGSASGEVRTRLPRTRAPRLPATGSAILRAMRTGGATFVAGAPPSASEPVPRVS